MAMGATAGGVLRLVLADGVKLVLAGAAAGIVASLFLGRVLQTMLFGVSSRDGLAYGATLVVLAVVMAAACVLPARAAMRVDPIEALRQE